jgi:hypothetical protein
MVPYLEITHLNIERIPHIEVIEKISMSFIFYLPPPIPSLISLVYDYL